MSHTRMLWHLILFSTVCHCFFLFIQELLSQLDGKVSEGRDHTTHLWLLRGTLSRPQCSTLGACQTYWQIHRALPHGFPVNSSLCQAASLWRKILGYQGRMFASLFIFCFSQKGFEVVLVAHRLYGMYSAVVVHGLSCSTVCGIFPDQGSDL